MIIKITLEKNLEEVVGKPITKGSDQSESFGKITDYNPETGEATLDMDDEKIKNSKWNPIAGENIGLSSREQ